MVQQNKVPRWLMRNSKGEPDSMWTLTFIAFVVTTITYLTSIFNQIQIGDILISFNAFDGLGYAAVVLVPLIGAYFGRRYTKEANETAVSKQKIYSEVAKRNINSSKPVVTRQEPSTSTTTIDNVGLDEEDLEAELANPKDEA